MTSDLLAGRLPRNQMHRRERSAPVQSKEVVKMSDDGEDMPIWLHWPAAIISSTIGLSFIILIVTSTMAQLSTSDWDSTIGIIEDYDYFCDYNGEETYCEEEIEYTYSIGDDIYYSDVTNLGWTKIEYQWYMSLGLTYGVTFEQGDEIVVYYNPYDPQNSVLIPGWDGIEFGDFFVILLAIIIPSVFLITARKKGTISEAINEFKGLAKTAKDFQQHAHSSSIYQVQWNGDQRTPIPEEGLPEGWTEEQWQHYGYQYLVQQTENGQDVQISSNVGKGGISPSRTRGYNSVIAKLSLSGGQMTEEMVKSKLQSELDLSQKDAQKFVDSPYVRSVIFPNNLSLEEITSSNIESDLGEQSLTNAFENQLISNFQAAMQDAMKEQEESNSPTTTLDSNVETCSHEGCNNVMTFYSFQCFSCRKKFCDEHKGASIHCADCA